LYDHFLAKNWAQYSEVPLPEYIESFYDLLEDNFETLPVRIQKMMPHMIADNWLLSYAKIEGIQKVLDGMNRRTKNISGMNTATVELKEFYTEFEEEFTSFFEELRTFSKDTLNNIENKLANEI
jgi:acyl carrier protein phosphodiesterase